jgi:hypothetical protein
MAVENTSGPSDVTSSNASTASQNTQIDNQTFKDMVAILKDLRTHTHQYYDDYTTACECQCQCQRGTV